MESVLRKEKESMVGKICGKVRFKLGVKETVMESKKSVDLRYVGRLEQTYNPIPPVHTGRQQSTHGLCVRLTKVTEPWIRLLYELFTRRARQASHAPRAIHPDNDI